MTDSQPKRPDPEVPKKTPRRRFTAQYRIRILSEVDACSHPGEIGAILRREGLYYSNINTWRRQRQEGALKGLAPKKRGRKRHEVSPLAGRIAELERDNKRLTDKLKQAETIIDVQKKISEIFGVAQPDSDDKNS
jgi:transposase-like protein